MEEFWFLILVLFIATNSLDKAESVKLELKTFDEIFGEGWWDKGEAEDLKTPAPTNFGQNVHHQIDRQNTQIGQIEPNSTDQNLPLTETIYNWKRELGQTMINYSDDEKVEIVKKLMLMKRGHSGGEVKKLSKEIAERFEKFDQMKVELTRAGFKNSFHHEIDKIVAKELGLSFTTIYNWKREFGQSTLDMMNTPTANNRN
uniref:Uncharacterized protein n=1 Tax=Globodera rostochiensis TaxID=31243 RepID=A0A914IBA9_GLORO